MKLHDETRVDCEILSCTLARLCITVFLSIKRKENAERNRKKEDEEEEEEEERILSQVSIE